MHYIPDDLRNISFKRSLVDGYSKKQVNDILNKIIGDYTRFIQENTEMKCQISVLNETLQHYKMLEESLQHSIIVTQHASEQIKINACEKAKNITDEAEVKAQKLIDNANQEVYKTRIKYEEIKSELFTFKAKSEALLQSQLEVLKQMFIE